MVVPSLMGRLCVSRKAEVCRWIWSHPSGRMRVKEMIFSGKEDNLWEGPEPGDNIAYMGSCQQFGSIGAWLWGEVNGGQVTKGLRSWTEESRLSQEY